MNKWSFFAVLCCILLLCALPAMAQEEQTLPVITITYASDASLSRETAVDAQITVTEDGLENSFQAKLRLNDIALDATERALPQQSLYIEGAETRFVLYNDGGDALRTKLLSTACSGLVAQGPVAVPVRMQEPVEVYINGEYVGLYSRREDIADAIARFEGLDSTDGLNVTDTNANSAFCGDASGIAGALQQIKSLNLSLEADRQTLDTLLDTESFLNWLAVNAYFGNINMNSDIIFYQIEDGPVKCAMGDFAFALMFASHNPYTSLETVSFQPVSVLENMLLNRPEYRNAFLTKLGALYQALPTQVICQAVDDANAKIASALLRHMERWADAFIRALGENVYLVSNAQEALLYQQYSVYRLEEKTLVRQPWYIYDLTQTALDVSDEDMLRYFGSAKPELPDVPTDTWDTYKTANR